MALEVLAQINNLFIMRLSVFILLFLALGCGSKKNKIQFPQPNINSEIKKTLTDSNIKIKDLNYIDFTNLFLSGNSNLEYNNDNYGFDLNFRFKKNEKILISGSLFLPIFKALIDQNKISGYQKFDRTFFDVNYEDIYNKLGIDLGFNEIENLLLGNPILDLSNKENFKIYTNDKNMLIYSIEKENVIYNMTFDPQSNKLLSQEITQLKLNRYLKIYYNSFQKLNSFELPRLIGIIINDGKNLIKLTISNQSREINNELSFPFKIPNNYKKIKLWVIK